MQKENAVQQKLLVWYDRNKRSFLFRDSGNPYYVWLSEIMLQQTRTETVAGYFERFVRRFPTVEALAQAEEEEVLRLWAGLGYYQRARNLHKAARVIAQNGMPAAFDALRALPGVGTYTAAAIASIAFHEPVPAMDGNLTRVIARLYRIEDNVMRPQVKRQLFALGQGLMPQDRPGDMNQALMDLGATVCVPGTPRCEACPLQAQCAAFSDGAPETLPQMDRKRPPKDEDVAVFLLTCGDEVLVFERREALLKGLYVFYLLFDAGEEAGFARRPQLSFLRGAPCRLLGQAKHVFTHRVWHMRIYHVPLEEKISLLHGKWVKRDGLHEIPMPTAQKAAKEMLGKLPLRP